MFRFLPLYRFHKLKYLFSAIGITETIVPFYNWYLTMHAFYDKFDLILYFLLIAFTLICEW